METTGIGPKAAGPDLAARGGKADDFELSSLCPLSTDCVEKLPLEVVMTL